MAWSTLIAVACLVAYVQAHGRLSDPPNRASLWRVGYKSPANYDDDGLNCGGFNHQYTLNRGRCGICGDAFNLPQPRPHELGGRFGLGYIVANYEAGQVITVNIYLSASHRGFWELRICTDPNNQQQECFDNGYLLELEDGETKYYPLRGEGQYILNYRLPVDLNCEHCVLQWMYTAGNNWGVCPNGTGALGCGNQEQFYSCSDISVTRSSFNEIDDELPQKQYAHSAPLGDGLADDFMVLNQLAMQLLKRGIDLSAYRIFYGDTPVTSNRMPVKHKYINKHRRKKNKGKKGKRHKKVLF